jgi:thioesterase domain-containing protein
VQGQLLKLSAVPYYDVPFDARDPEQLHTATLSGVASVTAISRYSPRPFPGPVSLVLSSDLTASFFGPAAHWKKILPNLPVAHAFQCGHLDLLSSHRHEVARLLKFMLSESFPEQMDSREPSQRRMPARLRHG